MIRTDLVCPGCGAAARPTLMHPPALYTCPECKLTIPRKELIEKRFARLALAGKRGGLPVPDPSPWDIFQGTTSRTGNLPANHGMVLAEGSFGNAACASAVVDDNGTPFTLIGSVGTAAGVNMSMWVSTAILPGTRTITVDSPGLFNNDVQIIAVEGLADVPTDVVATNKGNGTLASAGPTSALSVSGELVVGAVAGNSDGASSFDLLMTFTPGSIGATHWFGVDGPPNLALDAIYAPDDDQGGVSIVAPLVVSCAWTAMVATLKGRQ